MLHVPLYADGVPHSSSFNRGPEPRIQVYFRLVRTDRPAGCEKSFPAAQMDNWLVRSQPSTKQLLHSQSHGCQLGSAAVCWGSAAWGSAGVLLLGVWGSTDGCVVA